MYGKVIFNKLRKVTRSDLRNKKQVVHTIRLASKYASKRPKKMAIFAHDLIGSFINQFGIFEKDELDIVFDFLSPLSKYFINGLALDVGANVGNHSIYFSDKFMSVYSFEPNYLAYKLLSFNVSEIGKSYDRIWCLRS